jgi:hypothetical protein
MASMAYRSMPSTAAVLGAGLSNVERAAAKKVLSRLDIACQERRGEHDIAADERVLVVIGMDLDVMTRLVQRCKKAHVIGVGVLAARPSLNVLASLQVHRTFRTLLPPACPDTSCVCSVHHITAALRLAADFVRCSVDILFVTSEAERNAVARIAERAILVSRSRRASATCWMDNASASAGTARRRRSGSGLWLPPCALRRWGTSRLTLPSLSLGRPAQSSWARLYERVGAQSHTPCLCSIDVCLAAPAPEDLTRAATRSFIGRTTQLLKTKLHDADGDYSTTVPVTSAWYQFSPRKRTMHAHILTPAPACAPL